MIRNIISNAQDMDTVPEIRWELRIDGDVLRLIGNDGVTESKVLSIYKTGVMYRHRNVRLAGFECNNVGQIREYTSPAEAHSSHAHSRRAR
ncbi:MAG: hypothetical protein PHQ43_01140 [Dehalococcoidales bacterium]|nr:hypothetical protein [Dehalococcoidales bacterium]